MLNRWRKVTLGVVVAVALVAGPAAADEPVYKLAGSSSLLNKAEITISQGQSVPQVQTLLVENAGTDVAEIEMDPSSKSGIEINTDVTTFSLKPGERRTVRFGVTVSAGQPTGRFPVSLTAKQTNVPPPAEGGFGFAPGVTVKFVVNVAPANGVGKVNIKAVSTQDGTPVDGELTLAYVPKDSPPFVVARAMGNALTADVAPGPYQAKLAIPGLVESTQNFALTKGETKDITLKLEAIVFNATAAKPSTDGGKIVAVDLLASVSNKLRPIAGPVTFNAIVRRDGQQVDTVVLQTQPTLPIGVTDVRTNYRPQDGWEPGTYTFEFNVTTTSFVVTATQVPSVEVPKVFPWLLVGLGILSLVVIGAIIWALRRRRRSEQASAPPPLPEAPIDEVLK